jgi:hypothetical protein
MVYLRRTTLPSGRAWSLAVKDTGFAVAMDEEFEPEKFSGYLPCRYQGAPSGFEYFSGEVSEAERVTFEVPAEFDFVVTLATRGDEAELACSTIALGVLCRLTDGMLYDPQSGESISPDEAMDWVNELLKQLAN